MSITPIETFTSILLESVAPWDDPKGFWANYNTALGAMGEQVYGIISDVGGPDGSVIGQTSADLAAGINVTSIPTTPTAFSLPKGSAVIVVAAPGETLPIAPSQHWLVAADVPAGSTAIPVQAKPPNNLWPFDFLGLPAGSQIQTWYIPGWSDLLCPYCCPNQFLTYLAQFVGVAITPSVNPTTARNLLLSRHAHDRGTTFAITSAAGDNMTNTTSLAIFERTNPTGNQDAYFFLLVVDPTAVISVQALTDAVNSEKPAGVFWQLVQTVFWIITQMEARYPQPPYSITSLEGLFTNITALEIGPLPFVPSAGEASSTTETVKVRFPFSPILLDSAATSESITIHLA